MAYLASYENIIFCNIIGFSLFFTFFIPSLDLLCVIQFVI